jgi:hypothetical protein
MLLLPCEAGEVVLRCENFRKLLPAREIGFCSESRKGGAERSPTPLGFKVSRRRRRLDGCADFVVATADL